MDKDFKALWIIRYKHGYKMSTLYFHCTEEQVVPLFNMVKKRDFMQEIELFTYDLAGEVVDYEEYRPVSTGNNKQD